MLFGIFLPLVRRSQQQRHIRTQQQRQLQHSARAIGQQSVPSPVCAHSQRYRSPRGFPGVERQCCAACAAGVSAD